MHTTPRRVCRLHNPKPTEHWWHDIKVAAADTGGIKGSTPHIPIGSRPQFKPLFILRTAIWNTFVNYRVKINVQQELLVYLST